MIRRLLFTTAGVLALAAAPARASYHGVQVPLADAPWVASLAELDDSHKPLPPGYKGLPGYPTHCTAVVIGPETVLTATHCVAEVDLGHFGVRVGSADLLHDDGRIVPIARSYSPLLHAKGDIDYGRDVAVIQTTEPLGVPALPLAATPVQPGEQVSSFGFGDDRVDEHQDVESPLLRRLDMTMDPGCLNGVVTDTDDICTVGASGAGLRAGDSGSPLIAIRDGAPALVGIASATDHDQRVNIFADVLALRSFIAAPPASAVIPVITSAAAVTGDKRPGGNVACDIGVSPAPDKVAYQWWVGSIQERKPTVFHLPNGKTKRYRLVRKPDHTGAKFTLPRDAAGKKLTCAIAIRTGGVFYNSAAAGVRKLPRR